jgi:hypothetical protein
MAFGMSEWLGEIQVEGMKGKLSEPASDALLGRAV